MRVTSRQLQKFRSFAVERYHGWYQAPYVLTNSDCEPMGMSEVLALADSECQEMWETLSLAYPSRCEGNPALVEEIAQRCYSDIDPNMLNVLAPQEGIFLAMHALLEPGENVIVSAPAYQSLFENALAIDCGVTPWMAEETMDSDGVKYFHFDVDKLEHLLQQNSKTKMVIANFPHNPTGALPTLDEFKAIVDLCAARGIFFFCDEMYRQLEHEAADMLPAVADIYERGVSLSGMSKAYSMPGLRVGWLASQHHKTMQQVQQLKDYTTLCPSAPSEVLALIGVRNTDTIVGRNRSIIREGKAAVHNLFQRHGDLFEWTEPKAGTFAFPAFSNEEVSSKEYCDGLIEHAGVMLLPSSLFEHAEDNRFRITYGRADTARILSVWEGRCL